MTAAPKFGEFAGGWSRVRLLVGRDRNRGRRTEQRSFLVVETAGGTGPA